MSKKIFLNNKFWYKYKVNEIEVFYKGFHPEKLEKIFINLKIMKELKDITKVLNFLGDNFALIIKNKKEILAVADKIRSFPILYAKRGKSFYLFENFAPIRKLKFNNKVDQEQIFFFSMSGYSLGNGTIYKNIKQINPGTAVLFSKGIIKEIKYHLQNKKIIKNKKLLEKKLNHINEKIILKLIKSCNNKYIVIWTVASVSQAYRSLDKLF